MNDFYSVVVRPFLYEAGKQIKNFFVCFARLAQKNRNRAVLRLSPKHPRGSVFPQNRYNKHVMRFPHPVHKLHIFFESNLFGSFSKKKSALFSNNSSCAFDDSVFCASDYVKHIYDRMRIVLQPDERALIQAASQFVRTSSLRV